MSEDRARKTFREWHSKDPRRNAGPVKVPGLNAEAFASIGTAVQICYDSDKWEKDGDLHSYYHDHTSNPGVWLEASTVDEDEQVGRSARPTTLLGIRNRSKQLWVAQLGFCTSLTYKDKDGEMAELSIPQKSKMLSTVDKKGVIILTPKGPIIVRGGQLRVTHRGLVK